MSTDVSALQSDLAAKGVKYCIGAYVDIHGVPKGKGRSPLPPRTFRPRFRTLHRLCARLAWARGRTTTEISSVPDLGRAMILPWNSEVAWFPADNEFKGQPYEINARVALKKQIAEAEKMGLGFNLGIECEVYVVRLSSEGKLEIPNSDDDLIKSCYDVKRFMDRYPWLDKMATAIDSLGWELYSLDHEDGNSQFEFDFKYADALTMCDRYVFFRYMAKHYAAEEGTARHLHAETLCGQDRHRRAFQHVALRPEDPRQSFERHDPAEDPPRGLACPSSATISLQASSGTDPRSVPPSLPP